ncbi:hypothetical protein NXX77_08670 [Phocaeicola dorei]|nr:hypothetical protein [Phocaeicola dorei]
MENENAFLQKLDKIGNLTQVVCLSLFLTGVSVQGVSAETGFPISQSVQQTKTVTGQVVDETGEPDDWCQCGGGRNYKRYHY